VALTATVPALRRLLLARQGLLAWRGGAGRHRDGAPWRDRLRGAPGVLTALRGLEAIQLDPVNVVERNHHLVLMNRVGDYRPAHLERHYAARRVVEHWAQARSVLPVERYGELAPRRRSWSLAHTVGRMADAERIHAAAAEIRRILAAADGPLPSRALDLGHTVTSYWGTPTKVSSQALEHLWMAGEVVVAERRGDERHYALAERWYPAPAPGADDWAPLLRTYVRAYGIVDTSDHRLGWRTWLLPERRAAIEALIVDGTVVPVTVPGTRRRYVVAAALVPQLAALASARVGPEIFFLSPLDNLLWRRERILDLFGFEYRWEIYVPDHRRTYGPYVLPVLVGDRFAGRVDVRLDRDAARLVLRRAWWEATTTAPTRKRALTALAAFAARLGADLVRAPATSRG
jgi:uncharacterized protein YcaQ